jgi:hypothetical protein
MGAEGGEQMTCTRWAACPTSRHMDLLDLVET